MKQTLLNILTSPGKHLALLIDPDKHSETSLNKLIQHINQHKYPDVILVGGSLLFQSIDETVSKIKAQCNKPVYLFPGSHFQITDEADGLLFLSLLSGRNPEFLIGNHVLAAPKLKKSTLDIVPTGYVLIDCGETTSVSYMSNTTPIPYSKNDIAVATALAGEMLGLQAIYLEGGSGAKQTISTDMISAVHQQVALPLIVGGGIKNSAQLQAVFNAGATMAVVGNSIEQNPDLLLDYIALTQQYT